MAYVIVDKKTQARLSRNGKDFSHYITPKVFSYFEALEVASQLGDVEIKPESIQHVVVGAFLHKELAEEKVQILRKIINVYFFEFYVELNDMNLYEVIVRCDAQSPLHTKLLEMVSFIVSDLPYKQCHHYSSLND